MDYRHQPLGLRFAKPRAVAQGQIAEAKADTVADLTQIMQLCAIADGDLHRMAAAGAEIAVKELRSDPVLHRTDQRMLQVVAGMVFGRTSSGLNRFRRNGPQPMAGSSGCANTLQ